MNIYGLPSIAREIGVSVSTLKRWKADPTKPIAKYLARVGGRHSSSERLLAHLRDELLKQEVSR